MRKWPQNGGAEAMLKLPGGRWAVFSENAEAGEGLTEALLFSGDPAEDKSQIQKFSYRPPDGFALTDAAMMPDGRAIMLHRRFRPLEGVRAIVSIADPAQIAPGKIFSSRQLARFEPPLTVDNMEAVAVQEQDGEIIIWMASDDNFNPVQQSILLKFALIEPKPDASTQEKTGPEGPGFESLKE